MPDAAADAGPDAEPDGQLPDAAIEPMCGDEQVDENEDCDDGNTEPGDGCDAECGFEPLEHFDGGGVIGVRRGRAQEIVGHVRVAALIVGFDCRSL